ncbi:UPF0175 [Desulfonema limicola]|uniref:UPF0175 n=1 Tax=Desulfonema limicola TaxID=45656 RepID=A0A975BD74_9BACT|nr:UPF0175 family protein [Desulfonema limicola]QTA83105.1 UPF0175 [Desulfonema limicola]
MPQHSLIFQYGDDILFSLGMSVDDFAREARFLLSSKLYEIGKLTSGQAAKICGKSRVDFLLSLPGIGVSISNLPPENADAEIGFMNHA